MKRYSGFIILGVAMLVVVGLIWGLEKLNPTTGAASLSEAVNAADWVHGPTNTGVTLVEYSDFQCPACAAFEPMVQTIRATHNDRLTFVYRHFPLRAIHAHAQGAAQATEAAGVQGKFWEMHDLLFARQDEWAKGDADKLFRQYATELHLNMAQFESDFVSSRIQEKIEHDYQTGTASNVPGTPTFFLNGKQIQPKTFGEFEDMIKKALDAATPAQNSARSG